MVGAALLIFGLAVAGVIFLATRGSKDTAPAGKDALAKAGGGGTVVVRDAGEKVEIPPLPPPGQRPTLERTFRLDKFEYGKDPDNTAVRGSLGTSVSWKPQAPSGYLGSNGHAWFTNVPEVVRTRW